MSQKIPRNQRRKQAQEAAAAATPPELTPAQAVRRRRNRRMIFLAAVAVMLPLLEVLAYRYRSIQIIIANRTDDVVTNIKMTYPGGTIQAQEIKPGGELSKMIRPDYTFTSKEFSSYWTTISFSSTKGAIRQIGRTGTVDYSARETFTIENDGVSGLAGIKHTTSPGFPLGAIRDLLTKLGVG